jgi:hypothetical protein
MWWSQHLIYIFFCSFLSFFWFCFATEISTPKDAWRIGVQTILQFQQWAKPISNNLQLVSIGSRFSQRTVWCITNSDWIQNRSWTKCKTMHTVFSNLKFQEQWGLKVFIDKSVLDIKIHNTSTQYSDRALSNLSNKLRTLKMDFVCESYACFGVWCPNSRSDRENISGWKLTWTRTQNKGENTSLDWEQMGRTNQRWKMKGNTEIQQPNLIYCTST